MDEYIRCLRAIVDARSKVFIVLDALDECTSGSDECEDRSLHKFLDVIFQLQVTGNVNLLATSRFIPDISKRFDAALVQEVRASSDDITSYVSTEVKLMGGKIKGDDELQAVIKKTILEAVDGMFLMARLYIQSLRACMMTKRKVKEALERFARQQFASDTNRTHRAYDEAVLRIDSQNKEYQITARHALLWITYAERPLTANELIHALAVEGGKPSFDEDNVAHIEDVVSVCAGLVALDDKSGIIRLVHYTAYEYFQGTRPDWFQKTHSDITSLCVTYLSYDIFTSVHGIRRPRILRITRIPWRVYTSKTD
ncbi:hypothetical protein LMH87_001711 [Akanthomyces muscarius]|uniref:NACHT domain-containing protein n=1 Tax=Akanthomyces muscarius TaxID=2231603 RepID=A0A9W8Q726_AKAMU|nr:hypothetical protein LMH87_001711 [Akanthomyces muscarius]KAJ4147168.1 hypothetical protein LMH87_001711 [Akanthomyces muscarius]